MTHYAKASSTMHFSQTKYIFYYILCYFTEMAVIVQMIVCSRSRPVTRRANGGRSPFTKFLAPLENVLDIV